MVAAPHCAAAQQRQLPAIGFLHAATVESYVSNAAGFAQGLEENGFVEAQNLAIEYRFANGRLDRLTDLAADLARRPLAAIVAGGAAAALAASAATATMPIVVVSGSDPVMLGLAATPSRPGANVTGVTFTTAGLTSRKLNILRDLVPGATTIGHLAEGGRTYAAGSPLRRAIEDLQSELRAAADASGWQVVTAEIGDDRAYETAFATFVQHRSHALLVAPSAVFASDADDIIALTLRHEIPAMFERRADVIAAGLVSYGASRPDAWRLGGAYVGRILKGATPADMPLLKSDRLELTINQTIAESLGLTIPPDLLAQADEVVR